MFQRNRFFGVLLGSLCLSATLAAQTAVTVSVDAAGNPHAINPEIYGVNNAVSADVDALNCPLNRYGGNNTPRYNWTIDADNRARGFFFETFLLPPYSGIPGAYEDNFINSTQSVGAQPMITIPMGDWVGNLGLGGANTWSFSIAKYGAQCDNAGNYGGDPDAGDGFMTDCTTQLAGNDPNDANTPSTLNAGGVQQQDFINHLVSTHTLAPLKYYMLDNEPSIWWYDHFDVMPTGQHDDEMIARMESYGAAIKATDPNALVTGPEEWGWSGYLYSGWDQQNYSVIGTPDHDAHGDYIPYMLSQIYANDVFNGSPRSLDVLTVHFYPQGDAFGDYELSDDVSTATQNLRNQSTRSLWDPNYLDQSWIADYVQLVPRLKGYVSTNYPGLSTGLTEYSWGADGTYDSTLGYINGATAEADVLGILGREGIDLASRWEVPPAGGLVYNAMLMYRNYDGFKSTFGDVSISASSTENVDDFAVFGGSRTSDGSVTVMLVAKNLNNAYSATVQLANAGTLGAFAQVWQLSSPGLAISQLADAAVVGNSVSVPVPAQSITLLVIPASAVCPTITLSPSTLPDATVGTPYVGGPVTASGGVGPYTFAVTLGTFPSGMTLAADGTITGTPDTPGTVSFTVTATDTFACAGSLAYQINVNPSGCPTITLSPATLPGGTVGFAYAGGPVTASGGAGPYTFAVTLGNFPTGMTLAADGTITGAPSVSGTYVFTVTATDTNSCSGSQGYAVVISAGPLVFFTVAPCRLVDTRKPAGTYGGPALQGGGSQRDFPVGTQCGVPANAKAISINMTIVNPTASGDLRTFPTGTPVPNASIINFGAGRTRANNAVLSIDGAPPASLTIQTDMIGTTNFLLDINGYFTVLP